MLKEVAELKHYTMNEAIQFDKPQQLIRGTKPAISFKHVLPAATSTELSTKHKKTNNNFLGRILKNKL